ncbi:MAG: hypothetical protein VW915_02115 [Gammaproteobacteria bacterium]|jgi:hypothetical protein
MASVGKWTVIMEDKMVIKRHEEFNSATAKGLVVGDDDFWNQSKFDNIWAIQYGTSVASDEVEYRDETAHTSYTDANLGPISQFTDKWDAAHLADLQSDWDNDNVDGETSAEKITRLGARPTSYTSAAV